MFIKIALALATLLFVSACDALVINRDHAKTTESVSLNGTIESIDAKNRLFTVRGDTATVTFRAGPQVKNFGELEPGDRISLDYFESVAVGMANPNDPGDATGEVVTARAAPGQRPGAGMAGTLTGVVEFLSYDRRTHLAKVRLDDGTERTVTVPREMRVFAEARNPGDRVAVVIEQEMAVAVRPGR
ncbi:hypothetical protein [Tropicimonas sp. IMCC34043]|uniref:hypothetical protein n=1 Tax=Tropicimonas sp. IMCC34043 TaxID=2248760 RepID=UPI000E247E2B|nr:hypothetical protein [Tropicimonas sp. IMCC34043]